MLTRESVRELIGAYSAENFAKAIKAACAPATFVAVDHHVLAVGKDLPCVTILGVVKDLGGENGLHAPLLVADVPMGDKTLTERSSRIAQFKVARKVLEQVCLNPPVAVDGIIVQGVFVFHDAGGRFRVSLVTAKAQDGKLVWSQVKRQSFFVTPDPDRNATFIQRMTANWSSLAAIKEAFSVEKLTKEFYTHLFQWYQRACEDERVEYPNDLSTDNDNREDKNRKHLLRLITRLMFVWFLKQKGLVPAKLFDEEYLKGILKNFNPVGKNQHQYYRAILQNLFFATLNSEIEEREFAETPTPNRKGEKATTKHHGVKTKYRYVGEFLISRKEVVELFRPIPFLNGGLFECLDQEGEDGKVMYYDGFSLQEYHRDKGTLTWAHVPNDLFFDPEYGIIPLLKRYNFTVEENTPGDEDVALDPELLGKVFENLLGAYNPETEQVVRNSTGSFYTPREIVNYMVDESLIAYLEGKVGAKPVDAIVPIASKRKDASSHDAFETNASTIRALVKDGIRPADSALCRTLVTAIESAKIIDPACGSGAFPMGALLKMAELLRILKELPEDVNLYDLKLKLIENCIFGVDIQEIAVQISKLRIFISLVCEQKPDWNAPNYGINTLPNLETKFVAANSLIGLKRTDAKDGDKELRQADLFFDAGDIQQIKDELWDVRHKHFLATTRREKNALRKKDKTLRTKLAERGRELGFSDDATRLMASWDPYNQNVHADFFEPEWMFNVKDGFDVVIGNPPYISAPDQLKTEILKKQREFLAKDKRFKCLIEKWDLYICFMELSVKYLLSDGGSFSMIVPYPLTNQKYGAKLRQMLAKEYALREIVDLQGEKVFENATVTNCIPFVEKRKPLDAVWISKVDDRKNISRVYSRTITELMPDEKTLVWKTSNEENILTRYQDFHTLGDYCYISIGMVLNADEKSNKGAFTKDDLISEKEDRIHSRQYVEAKDIDRYVVQRVRYLEYGTKRCPGQLRRPTFPELYDRPKLLTNKIGAIKAVLDLQRLLCDQTNRICILWHELDCVENDSISASVKRYSQLDRETMSSLSKQIRLQYLLAVLNSTFGSKLLEEIRGPGNIDVNPNCLRSIPIPNADEKQQRQVCDLVDKILAAKKKDSDADTSALESKIDELVYDLYGLAKEEREIVEAGSGPCGARDIPANGGRGERPARPQSGSDENAMDVDCGHAGRVTLPAGGPTSVSAATGTDATERVPPKKVKAPMFEEEF